MTDLFILLAAVTVLCTGAAVPCFFKSSRFTAGCLILSAAVLAATAACFATPVKECFAAFSKFDIWYFSGLFAAAFLVSLFYRPLFGIALILYVLWCAVFLIILLPAGYSPSESVGEITVASADARVYQLEKVTFSQYQLLPYKKVWYKTAGKDESSFLSPEIMKLLSASGVLFSADSVELPESVTYPHVYFLSMDAGNPAFETLF